MARPLERPVVRSLEDMSLWMEHQLAITLQILTRLDETLDIDNIADASEMSGSSAFAGVGMMWKWLCEIYLKKEICKPKLNNK